MYVFECAPWGLCKVEARTSGNHGFGLPKIFRFTSCNGNFHGSYTLRYKNQSDLNIQISVPDPSTLIRVAIAQFCAWKGDHDVDIETNLDPSFLPFIGEVTNRHGRTVSRTSLLPQDTVRNRRYWG